jgi:hypothetical protein
MSKIPSPELRRPESTSDPDIVKSFPFITNDAWYREYWYEREPGRLLHFIIYLHQLSSKAGNLVRVLIGAWNARSRPTGPSTSAARPENTVDPRIVIDNQYTV